jgi:hypothetical protein
MEVNRKLKEFIIKANRDIGFLIEGVFYVWALTKLEAIQQFKIKYSNFIIRSVKKSK